MPEDQKRLIVAFGIAILILFSLFALCSGPKDLDARSKSKFSSKISKKTISGSQNKKNRTNLDSKRSARNSSSYSESYSNYSSPISYSKEERSINDKILEEMELEHEEYLKNKFQELLNDPNTPPEILLKAQLLNSEEFVEADTAYRNKNYKDAVNKYYEFIKKDDTTSEMKFLALEKIEYCAKYMGDLELYIMACREKALLLSKEDLELLGYKKTDNLLKWVEKFERYMNAYKNPSIKRDLIESLTEKYLMNRRNAEKYVDKKINMYRALFKEFAK